MYYTAYEVLHTTSHMRPMILKKRYYSSNVSEVNDFVRIMRARHPHNEYKIIKR